MNGRPGISSSAHTYELRLEMRRTPGRIVKTFWIVLELMTSLLWKRNIMAKVIKSLLHKFWVIVINEGVLLEIGTQSCILVRIRTDILKICGIQRNSTNQTTSQGVGFKLSTKFEGVLTDACRLFRNLSFFRERLMRDLHCCHIQPKKI